MSGLGHSRRRITYHTIDLSGILCFGGFFVEDGKVPEKVCSYGDSLRNCSSYTDCIEPDRHGALFLRKVISVRNDIVVH